MDFSRIFSPRFIFNPTLGSMKSFDVFFYLFFGLLLILAIISYLLVRKNAKIKNLPYEKLWRKILNFSLYLGILGYFLLFFRQQRVYFLSMPFFMYSWFIGLIVWATLIICWVKKRFPKIIEENKKREELKKYLK